MSNFNLTELEGELQNLKALVYGLTKAFEAMNNSIAGNYPTQPANPEMSDYSGWMDSDWTRQQFLDPQMLITALQNPPVQPRHADLTALIHAIQHGAGIASDGVVGPETVNAFRELSANSRMAAKAFEGLGSAIRSLAKDIDGRDDIPDDILDGLREVDRVWNECFGG